MPDVTTTKALTVRLPADLHREASKVAEGRQISLNALIEESIARLVRAEEYARLSESFDLLADDPDESDVEYALTAQREVVLRDAE